MSLMFRNLHRSSPSQSEEVELARVTPGCDSHRNKWCAPGRNAASIGRRGAVNRGA